MRYHMDLERARAYRYLPFLRKRSFWRSHLIILLASHPSSRQKWRGFTYFYLFSLRWTEKLNLRLSRIYFNTWFELVGYSWSTFSIRFLPQPARERLNALAWNTEVVGSNCWQKSSAELKFEITTLDDNVQIYLISVETSKQQEKPKTRPTVAPKPILSHRKKTSLSSGVEEGALESVYVNTVPNDYPSEEALTTESDDIIHDARERIASRESLSSMTVGSLRSPPDKDLVVSKPNGHPRVASLEMQERISTWEEVAHFKKKLGTAEKMTSPPASSLIKTISVSDKSMQTMLEWVECLFSFVFIH